MKLALTTEYAFGPRELEDLMRMPESKRECDGYSIMRFLNNNFGLNYYEFTCWLPESSVSGVKKFLSQNPDKNIISVHAYAPLRKDFVIGNHPADNYNLSSCHEKRRSVAVRDLKKTIRLADELKAKYVVVHAGFKERNQSRGVNLNSLLKSVEESVKFVEEDNLSVQIGVENGLYPSNIFISPEEIKEISDFYPRAGLWFDVGHSFVNKNSDTGKLIDSCGDLILGLHLHNNDGKKDLHAPLEKGKINFKEILNPFLKSIRENKIPLILEVHKARFYPSPEDIFKSFEILRDIVNN